MGKKFALVIGRRKTSVPRKVIRRAVLKALREPDIEPDPSKPEPKIVITNREPKKIEFPKKKKASKKPTPKKTAAKKSISKNKSKR